MGLFLVTGFEDESSMQNINAQLYRNSTCCFYTNYI